MDCCRCSLDGGVAETAFSVLLVFTCTSLPAILLASKHTPVEACNNRLNKVGAKSLFIKQRRHQLPERGGFDVALLPQRVHGHAESQFLVEGLLISGKPRKSDEKSGNIAHIGGFRGK